MCVGNKSALLIQLGRQHRSRKTRASRRGLVDPRLVLSRNRARLEPAADGTGVGVCIGDTGRCGGLQRHATGKSEHGRQSHTRTDQYLLRQFLPIPPQPQAVFTRPRPRPRSPCPPSQRPVPRPTTAGHDCPDSRFSLRVRLCADHSRRAATSQRLPHSPLRVKERGQPPASLVYMAHGQLM
ncbi:hypothetical protein SMALA_8645 (plasmid) [Streptomyces malaysiensis subsp. malaysiensis]|nr:hypothetical protein SMALA_8645 [Streptomyces malaysiensis]